MISVMDRRPRKQRKLKTFVSGPSYHMLDRMLGLVFRFRKSGNLDIFYKIWGDVLSAVYNKKFSLRQKRDPYEVLQSRFLYVPRLVPLLWTYVTDPDGPIVPPLHHLNFL